MIRTSTAPYGITLLRVSLGILFLAHVALKVFVFTIPGFVSYFASLHLPAILAYGTIALEAIGGVALVLGIYAPWVAVPLALEMLGTIVIVHTAQNAGYSQPPPLSVNSHPLAPCTITMVPSISSASGTATQGA